MINIKDLISYRLFDDTVIYNVGEHARNKIWKGLRLPIWQRVVDGCHHLIKVNYKDV